MELTIRKATLDDYNAVCELFDEIDALHRDNLPHIFQKTDGTAREQAYYADQIADENIALLLAEVGVELVGVVHAIIRDAPDFPIFMPRCYAVVDSLVVKSGFQHHGIGKALMEKMHDWAAAKGAASIELNVFEFNHNAILFYEILGYQALSRKMSMDLKRDNSSG